MQLGMVGLGRMGANMVRRLITGNHESVVFDRSPKVVKELVGEKAVGSSSLQDLVKNYVSGFYVLMEKNVRVGDLVESGGYRGLVTDIRMRVTYLRGARGEMIVVPNGELFNRTLVVSAAPPNWVSGPERAHDDPDQGVEVVAH